MSYTCLLYHTVCQIKNPAFDYVELKFQAIRFVKKRQVEMHPTINVLSLCQKLCLLLPTII
jgi:hypothetical protein